MLALKSLLRTLQLKRRDRAAKTPSNSLKRVARQTLSLIPHQARQKLKKVWLRVIRQLTCNLLKLPTLPPTLQAKSLVQPRPSRPQMQRRMQKLIAQLMTRLQRGLVLRLKSRLVTHRSMTQKIRLRKTPARII